MILIDVLFQNQILLEHTLPRKKKKGMSLKIVLGGQAFSFELALFWAQSLDFGGVTKDVSRSIPCAFMAALQKMVDCRSRRLCIHP